MAMEEKIQMGSHKLTLQNRGSVMLTGVKDVVAFDENQVVLDTELGLLTIKGKNLHMNRLTLDLKDGSDPVPEAAASLYPIYHRGDLLQPAG